MIRKPNCCYYKRKGRHSVLKRFHLAAHLETNFICFVHKHCGSSNWLLFEGRLPAASLSATQLLWFKPFCSSLSFSLRRVTERCFSDAIVFGLSWPWPSSSACSSTSLAHLPRSAKPLLGLLGSCGPASRRGQGPPKTSTAWTLVLCLAGLQLWALRTMCQSLKMPLLMGSCLQT